MAYYDNGIDIIVVVFFNSEFLIVELQTRKFLNLELRKQAVA